MNDTKWTEIFKAFYYGAELVDGPAIPWTTKTLEGYVYSESTWTHFGIGTEHSKDIEWLRIELTPENRDFVQEALRKIHLPGEVKENCVIVYGHRMDVDYI